MKQGGLSGGRVIRGKVKRKGAWPDGGTKCVKGSLTSGVCGYWILIGMEVTKEGDRLGGAVKGSTVYKGPVETKTIVKSKKGGENSRVMGWSTEHSMNLCGGIKKSLRAGTSFTNTG